MKNDIITDGTYKKFLEIKHVLYINDMDYSVKEHYLDYLNKDIIDECFQIYNNNKQRKTRSLDKILHMVFAKEYITGHKNDILVLLTITFTNKVLSKTTKQTRRRYVQRFLQRNTEMYLANIDFGEKNGREHYHAVALLRGKIEPNKWGFGNLDIKRIGTSKEDYKRAKNYVMKLNNHSYKESTKQERLIYPKNILVSQLIDWVYPKEYHIFKTKFLAK